MVFEIAIAVGSDRPLGRVFPRPFRHGGTSEGRQSVNGGTHEGDIYPMGGPNFDRLYHKLKVLLLLLILL